MVMGIWLSSNTMTLCDMLTFVAMLTYLSYKDFFEEDCVYLQREAATTLDVKAWHTIFHVKDTFPSGEGWTRISRIFLELCCLSSFHWKDITSRIGMVSKDLPYFVCSKKWWPCCCATHSNEVGIWFVQPHPWLRCVQIIGFILHVRDPQDILCLRTSIDGF